MNNVVLFLALGAIQQTLISPLDGPPPPPSPGDAAAGEGGVPPWWASLYRIAHVVLGQELPEEGGLASQLFSVLVAVLGLASFALVLALIEQVVLEVLESNVKRGSAVYEDGHVSQSPWLLGKLPGKPGRRASPPPRAPSSLAATTPGERWLLRRQQQ